MPWTSKAARQRVARPNRRGERTSLRSPSASRGKAICPASLRAAAHACVQSLESRVLLSVSLVSDHLFGTQGSQIGQIVDVNGTSYFTAFTSSEALWKSDGTAGGTVLLKDFGAASNAPSNLTSAGGALYFSAAGSNGDVELWKSDGTPAGTALLKDIAAGPNSSSPSDFTQVGGAVYFSADDGDSGRELWKTDGTAGGTVLVKDIKPGTAPSNPADLTNA